MAGPVMSARALKKLETRIARRAFVDRIRELDNAAGRLPFEVFREPVAITELNESGNNRLVNLDAQYLKGWTRHIAYSMRVRLRALEPGIVLELSNGRALAAQVLLRSHLEASGMATLCLQELMKRDFDALSKLVPQTLFGTALFNKAKRDERVAKMLTYSEQRTITISQAMAALHRFAYPNGKADNTSVAYSLLCEASHPNHRGTKTFVHVQDVDASGEYGWYVTYSERESVPAQLTDKLVEVLLFSMSCGYAATELLRNMEISDSAGGVVVHGVNPEIGERIWFDILNRTKRVAAEELKTSRSEGTSAKKRGRSSRTISGKAAKAR